MGLKGIEWNRAKGNFKRIKEGAKGNGSGRRICFTVAAAVLGTQFWKCQNTLVFAGTEEWEGIRQISASEQYTELDTATVSLIVEEVYAEAGGYAQEGQSILKVTDDSYQEALDYYAAAIIYAQNDLTDVRMAYDIGMQEAEYSLELARAEAEQAEFVKDQHLKELEDTIKDHEEIMTEIEEAIEEYEEGIAAGSYSSVSSSSGSSGSGSSASGSSSSDKENSPSSDKEEEKESESEAERLPGPETEEEIPLDSEQSSDSGTLPEPGETEKTEGQSDTENQLAVLEQQIAYAETRVSDLKDKAATISSEIEKKNEAYDEVLKKMYQILNLGTDNFCGTGRVVLVNEENGTADRNSEEEQQTELLLEEEEPEAGIETKQGIKTGSAEEEILPEETVVQEIQETEMLLKENQDSGAVSFDMLSDMQSPGSQPAEADSAAEVGFLLEDTADAPEADSKGDEDPGGADANVDGNSVPQSVGKESETQDSEGETESGMGDTIDTLLIKLNGMEEERTRLYEQLETIVKELEAANAELEVLEKQKTELTGNNQKDDAAETDEPGTGDAAGDKNIPGAGDASDEKTIPGTGDMAEDKTASGTEGASGDKTVSGTEEASGDKTAPGTGDTSGDRSATENEGTQGEGSSAEKMSGEGFSDGSGAGVTSAGFSAGGGSSSGDTESLFGDTYDLNSVENLLERTASSEEEAESILEELEEASETVESQYAELTRNEKITKLGIQYTYDTAVIAGKLAEITYQQEAEALKKSLWEAENSVTKLQGEKAKLEALTDGVVTAENSGSIAAVNYEAGDELSSSTALYSIYDTDVVTVTLSVSQYEISQFHVGDVVNVELSNYGAREGTVTAKSPEASEGSSRTSVNYEVEITIDNSNGRLSPGVSAAVSREVAEDE